MSDRHLDDEQLSALLDGEPADRAHLASCASCASRLTALGDARDALAAATVAPLPADVLDALVGRALDAATTVDPAIVPLTRGRRRPPPPTWLAGAAAALVALVGAVGLLRVATDAGSSNDSAASVALTNGEGARRDDAETDKSAEAADAGGAAVVADAAASAAPPGVDPEVVAFDLGDQHDPSELGVLLRDQVQAGAGAGVTSGTPTAGSVTTAVPQAPRASAADRAQCRNQAQATGAGDGLGPLLSTGTVRWKGQDAEVLVFLLASPSSGVTRQAMVLQRPGCSLLAERRF
jgi:hypothetical protein